MYEKHFGLAASPFSIAPDPRFLYMSERHREALAHLLYGIGSDGGFVLLTGEVGTGKTTISRCLLEQIPENSNVALILNPKVIAGELLATICDDLGIKYPEGNASIKIFVDSINDFLLENNAQGRKTVVIIEESQNLTIDVLEQLRLLTNLETHQRKLLQFIMIGQPEFLDMLANPDLRQLAQRITARYHLKPMTMKETGDYVSHRLLVAGMQEPVFTGPVLKLIYRLSYGIPRRINLLCDRAMLGAYVEGVKVVDARTVKKAAIEVFGETIKVPTNKPKYNPIIAWTLATLAAIATGAGIASVFYKPRSNDVEMAALKSRPELASSQLESIEPPIIGKPIESAVVQTAPLPAIVIAATAKNVPTKSVPSDTLQLLLNQPVAGSKKRAYGYLFKTWDVDISGSPGSDLCQLAITKNLKCLRNSGNLNSLRRLNRPGVMIFINGKGKAIYAAITALYRDQAIINFDGEARTISLSELESNWYGGYTVLWRVPKEFQRTIRPGSSGTDVAWLARQLTILKGHNPANDLLMTYDKGLRDIVEEFQLKSGLIADGIVGPRTVIHINTEVGLIVPVLNIRDD